MSLKEFDAKQFLLEKGEQVGLGIALTLMVLMLIFSLFMPSKGFFSGSPAAKAKELNKGAKELETALHNPANKPQGDDNPKDPKSGLIDLNTAYLLPNNYKILGFYPPKVQESPYRRPPSIYNIDKGVVAFKRVLIDTYLFVGDFQNIVVLREKGRDAPTGGGGGNNPFKAYSGGGMAPPGVSPGGMSNPYLEQSQGRLGNNFQGGADNFLLGPSSGDFDYDAVTIPVKDWNPQELTARQPRPLRVAVIGGSFPYRKQLEEFKQKLRLPDINAVRNELMEDKKRYSFEFVGVEVERREVDADGNHPTEWSDLHLKDNYQLWLKHTYRPFQPEDPKYNFVKFDGLVSPLLRAFHANKRVDPTMRTPSMMAFPGMPQPPGSSGEEFTTADTKDDYPDVVAKLQKIQGTLADLSKSNVNPALIAAPKTKKEADEFDPFHPYATPQADANAGQGAGRQNEQEVGQDWTIPEYALVRVMDLNLEPGKNYQYRLRIKMNNPNYQRKDVASPEYKDAKELKSKDWYEIKQTLHVPSELKYYVVDEKKGVSFQEQKAVTRWRVSAQSRMWAVAEPHPDQVVFQFHRWVEATPLSRRDSDVVPVGSWAVADRVYVSRGEYVGRKVRVDLPIWKYSKNAYVLPAEKPEKKRYYQRKTTSTGIDVDFGYNRSPNENRILVDFEGGPAYNKTLKIDDDCRTEVLMLGPDGKLLARNSAKDKEDEERSGRRFDVLRRIEDIRAGRVAE